MTRLKVRQNEYRRQEASKARVRAVASAKCKGEWCKMEGEQRFERGRGLKARLGRPALIGPKIPKSTGVSKINRYLLPRSRASYWQWGLQRIAGAKLPCAQVLACAWQQISVKKAWSTQLARVAE